jgi:hypothetical protein
MTVGPAAAPDIEAFRDRGMRATIDTAGQLPRCRGLTY